MSFVDLATLAMHRRHEMEARIQVFLEKCDHAISDINKLKDQAQGFVQQLNCEPSELRDRFLNCMKYLDEYTYLITDFNLAVGRLDETSTNDLTPVLDTTKRVQPSLTTFNIMDTLTEPMPSTSKACFNQCPVEKPKKKRIPKEDQLLIAFSSTSCSSESVPVKFDSSEKESQAKLTEDVKNIKLEDSVTQVIENCNLPAQTVLQLDKAYPAVILHVDGLSFWVTTDNIDDAFDLTMVMTKYYHEHKVELNLDQVMSLTYCALYEEESDSYYRAFFIKLSDEDMSMAEVYLVDMGETRYVPTCSLQPLQPMFCQRPPFARCCHLAGVDLLGYQNKDILKKQELFILQFIAKNCSIVVDDNTSESLGVYVVLPTKERINDLIVAAGLATKIDKNSTQGSTTPINGFPELAEENCDITQCPEYEDPVVAVTGYHNRDEADICKHYKGGPEKNCFKGARCTKKHVVKHPDGWTLDRVSVPAKLRSLPLPAPGTWLRVLVTHVAHFDRFYVHFVTEKKPEQLPSFGVVLPPTTLASLVRDMNSPATRTAYKPLQTVPAPGELVAALYPLDDQWYRARVVSSTRADQNVEVMYVDYGNMVWVKEDAVRQLAARCCALPAQAVLCALAGVAVRASGPPAVARARAALAALIQERTLDAHVIATGYDEITVELYDEKGQSIAEQLAATKVVELREYTVEDNTGMQQKLVVP